MVSKTTSFSAAIEHAIDVVRVISLDIAANEGGDVGHLRLPRGPAATESFRGP